MRKNLEESVSVVFLCQHQLVRINCDRVEMHVNPGLHRHFFVTENGERALVELRDPEL